MRMSGNWINISCAALSGVLFIGAGCSDNDRDRDDSARRVERIEETRISRPPADRDSDYPDRSGRIDRTPPAERLDRRGVPRDALLLQEGSGGLTVRPRDAGTIYLYDTDDNRVVWSGQIDRGDRFSIESDADSAMINGRTVYHDQNVRRHRHQVFIDTNSR